MNNLNIIACQIADFGMARDVTDDSYYESSNSKLPVRWTAPEVWMTTTYSSMVM